MEIRGTEGASTTSLRPLISATRPSPVLKREWGQAPRPPSRTTREGLPPWPASFERSLFGQVSACEGPVSLLHAPAQHPARIVEHDIAAIRILHPVHELIRVFAQIEQQRRQRREMYVFPVAVTDHGKAALIAGDAQRGLRSLIHDVAKIVFVMRFTAPAGRMLVLQERQQRF